MRASMGRKTLRACIPLFLPEKSLKAVPFVSATTPVTVSASDNVAVASVQIYLDGHPLGPALTAAPYSYSWDTTAVSDGTHQLSATATDTSGNVGTAAVITVDVMNPPPPMTCFIMDVNTSVHGYGKVTTASFHTAQAGE